MYPLKFFTPLWLIGFALVQIFSSASCDHNQDLTGCTELCCDSTMKYCGITEAELDQSICNYRNQDWTFTSPYFSSNTLLQYQAVMASSRSATTFDSLNNRNFDARYMDMDLEALENYLCYIKNANNQIKAMKLAGKIKNLVPIDKIRFYYIRHDDNPWNMDYANKHSMAMVPVQRDGQEFTQSLDSNSMILPLEGCSKTAIANHNSLCPPEPPACSDRIYRLDKDLSTY